MPASRTDTGCRQTATQAITDWATAFKVAAETNEKMTC